MKANHGIGFMEALLLLFIGLKLTGYIAWSWWFVLSPIWIVFVVSVIAAFIAGFIGAFNRKTKHADGKGGSKV